jgi:hypothetical protein
VKFLIIVVVLIGLICAFGAGAMVGFDKARVNATLMEVKILRAVLLADRRSNLPEDTFRQFVLARYYSQVLGLDSSLRQGIIDDFGSLDANLLNGILIAKDPVEPKEIYSRITEEASRK